jgi:hypothetical protein
MSSDTMRTANEPVAIRGQFWRPEAEEPKLFGQLTYSQSVGAALELYGTFGEPWSTDPRNIWGTTIMGTPVTLFDVYLDNQSSGATTDDATSYYTSYTAAIGRHYLSTAEIKARQARIGIEQLNHWARLPGSLRPTRRGDGTTIIELLETKPLPLGSHGDIAIALEPIRQETWTFDRVVFQQDCILTFTSPKEEDFVAFDSMTLGFQQLLALCTGMPHNITGMWLEVPPIQDAMAPTRGVQIVRKLSTFEPTAQRRGPRTYLATLMPEAASYVSTFYRNLNTVKSICDFWYATITNPHQYLEQHFLFLVFALETAHRTLIGGEYKPKEEFLKTIYPRLVDAIPQGVQQEFRDSMKNRLQYLHEFAFPRRVREICERVKEIAVPLKARGTGFARRVADVRNTLAHQGNLGDVLPADVIKLSDQLSIIIQAVLLKEVGIAGEPLRILALTGRESLMA